jgi:hypothetical protein
MVSPAKAGQEAMKGICRRIRGQGAADLRSETAFIPEEGPDEAEGGNDLVGIDFFALPVILGELDTFVQDG